MGLTYTAMCIYVYVKKAEIIINYMSKEICDFYLFVVIGKAINKN